LGGQAGVQAGGDVAAGDAAGVDEVAGTCLGLCTGLDWDGGGAAFLVGGNVF